MPQFDQMRIEKMRSQEGWLARASCPRLGTKTCAGLPTSTQRQAGASRPSGLRIIFVLAIALGLIEFARLHPPLLVFSQATAQRPKNGDSSTYGPATQLAVLKDKSIKESSGIAASRNHPGLYWTHNDSGDGPFIYAFDNRGNSRGVWRVTGASAQDWEDIAAGPGPRAGTNYLYIGDIGDNNGRRNEVIVYRVLEPTIGKIEPPKGKTTATEPAEEIRLRYPDGSHNAEALLIHPKTGNLYIATKVPFGYSGIYEAQAPLTAGQPITLQRRGNLALPSLIGAIITGGAISPDGRRVAFCDYLQGYEIVLADDRAAFNTIWSQRIVSIDLGKREQGEAITYRLDGKALLMTSEGSPMPLTQVVRK